MTRIIGNDGEIINGPLVVNGSSRVTGDSSIGGVLTSYNGVAVVGVPVIRATGQRNAVAAVAVASICTFTPVADQTIDVTASVLVTVSNAEDFTLEIAYTDTGNTARVATVPLRLLTGADVLIVNNANGAIPYAGVLQRIRVKGGTSVTVRTQAAGTYTGCTYSVGADIRQGA